MDDDDVEYALRIIRFFAVENYRRFHGRYSYDDFYEMGHEALVIALWKAKNNLHFASVSMFGRAYE